MLASLLHSIVRLVLDLLSVRDRETPEAIDPEDLRVVRFALHVRAPNGRPSTLGWRDASRRSMINGTLHDHPIGLAPADSLDLALKNLNVAASRQHLSLKLGLVALTGCEHI
jgi:hypothetical protein